jgi:hypothetical protein
VERLSRQQQTAAIVLCCLFLIGTALFVRRLAGAFAHELPAGEAALYACLFATAAVASLRNLRMSATYNGFAGSAAALILSLLFVAGLSSEPANVLACLASVAIVIALAQRSPDAAVVQQQPAASAETQDADELAAAGEASPVPASRVSLMRSAAGGTERIEGSLAIEFEVHEQAKTLHVPLWPPLEAEPAVECRLEGLDGRVRVPLAKRHGFRIEVRLPEACDEPLAGTLKFTATAACRSAAA